MQVCVHPFCWGAAVLSSGDSHLSFLGQSSYTVPLIFFFPLWFLSSLSETFNQMVHILELTSNFLLSFLLLILFIPHFVFWAVLGLYLPDNLWKLFKS